MILIPSLDELGSCGVGDKTDLKLIQAIVAEMPVGKSVVDSPIIGELKILRLGMISTSEVFGIFVFFFLLDIFFKSFISSTLQQSSYISLWCWRRTFNFRSFSNLDPFTFWWWQCQLFFMLLRALPFATFLLATKGIFSIDQRGNNCKRGQIGQYQLRKPC